MMLSHLTYPINYCDMAKVCIHDSREVCGSGPDACSLRRFNDQCDMYEYNCDYGTHFEPTPCDVVTVTSRDSDTDYLENVSNKKYLVKNKNSVEYKNECWPHCNRPNSWITTAKGEKRDFFRVLLNNK
ncbi:uncharacterized protein LOC113520271 isoform X2 [Galleria mellonella]|nr:uncharacterized protein LOC113520271 isoform X2 [Galleria mellonella]